MPPFRKRPLRKLSRLISRASEDWRTVVEDLLSGSGKKAGPRPLRVMRLEKRRVLSADFSFVGGALVLDGFDSPTGDSLAIVQDAEEYQFTTDQGWSTDGPTPDGVTVDGDTLSVDRGVIESLSRGLTVADNDATPLDVTLGQADFSNLSGPVSLLSPASLGQQAQTTFTAPSAGLQVAAASSGLTLTSMSVAGDLNLLAFGTITDTPGAQIFVTGDATFTTVDDGSGGSGPGSGNGGIHLADNPGDRLEVQGRVWFDGAQRANEPLDAPDKDSAVLARWDITVGLAGDGGPGGWTEFGNVIAEGDQVAIRESASTTLEFIDANDFTLTSAGRIETTVGAEILVVNDANLTSNETRFQGDFDGNGVVDLADRTVWDNNFGQAIANPMPPAEGDSNGDGVVDAADYTLWRDQLGSFSTAGGIDITVADTFSVGGLASLVAQPTSLVRFLPEFRYDITVGEEVEVNFGSLDVRGRDVFVAEDGDGISSATLLAGVDAQDLTLLSEGRIDDTPTAIIAVTQDAAFVSTGGVRLADDNTAGTTNSVVVGGIATFAVEGNGGGIAVGAAFDGGPLATANFQAGKIRFGSTDEFQSVQVDIREDDSTTIASWSGASIPAFGGAPLAILGNNAAALDLYSAGSITDDPGVSIRAFDAVLVAQESVILTDSASDRYEVNFLTSVVAGVSGAGSIDLGVLPNGDKTEGFFETSLVRFASPDTVRINDAFGTLIEAWSGDGDDLPTLPSTSPTTNAAQTLVMVTDGGISDEAATTIDITGDATFIAPLGVRLADEFATNQVTVGGATSILVPVSDPPEGDSRVVLGIDLFNDSRPADGTFNTGKLRINAMGQDVFVAESSDTVVASWDGVALPDFPTPTGNQSQNLLLISEGSITDDPGVVIDAADAATLSAVGEIVLADQDDAGNQLRVGGLGQFTVTPDGGRIALGVDPTTGAPVGSEALIGRMALIAAEGEVDVALDGDATFDRESNAGTLNVTSAEDILDADPTTTSGVRVFVTGDAGFTAGGNILLSDSGSSANELDVAGNARFEVASGGSIDVGIRVAGSRLAGDIIQEALSGTELGTVTYVAPDGAVRIAQDNAAVLTGASQAAAASLLSNESISNEPGTTVDVAGSAWFGASDAAFAGRPITLGNNPSDRLTFGSLAIIGGDTQITEHTDAMDASPGTVLRDVSVDSLRLDSAGPITDAGIAAIVVSGESDFSAVGSIVLADSPDANNMLALLGHSQFSVVPDGGRIDIGVDPATGLPADSMARIGLMSFTAIDGEVRVALDDTATFDRATNVGTLSVHSAGTIQDATPSGDAVTVTTSGDATFIAEQDIRLSDADDGLNSLAIGGLGSFTVGSGRDLDLGVVTATGAPADSLTTVERLTFDAPDGDVRIALDNVILLEGMIEAGTLSLNSVGDILDAPGTTIEITGATELTAQTPTGERRRIILGDNLTDVTSFGSLNLTGSEVSIQEDTTSGDATPGTLLTGVVADTLRIESDGPITDSSSADIQVVDDASLRAGGDITLADDNSPGSVNSVVVGGNASFSTNFTFAVGQAIDVGVQADGTPALANFTAGTLTFFAADGTVRIAEDDGLELTGPSGAEAVELRSAGAITDALITDATAVELRVNQDASLIAQTTITLADSDDGDNVLTALGVVRFESLSGGDIRIGVDDSGANVESFTSFGSLTFVSGDGLAGGSDGTVTIHEDSSGADPSGIDELLEGVLLVGESSAGDLVLSSDFSVRDGENATVTLARDALVTAQTGITLADDNTAGAANRLIVANGARFVVAEGRTIDVGVQADGAPAEASFTAGTLSFSATLGTVRIAEDDGLALTDGSNAAIVCLHSAGSITDTPSAVLNVTADALIDAADDIVLANDNTLATANSLAVDGAARFVVATGQAIDVGVQADGTPAEANFQAGTLSFSATLGTVRIAEDDSLVLAGNSDAATLRLRSEGSITDDFLTSFKGNAIATPLALVSVTDTALFDAEAGIILADDDSVGTTNGLMVTNNARFVVADGQSIDVGVLSGGTPALANFQAGTLTFSATLGTVRIAEDDGLELADTSDAETVRLHANGTITDAADAVLEVTDTAVIDGEAGIVLADDDTGSETTDTADDTPNRLEVTNNVYFIVADNQAIDVGVTPDGLPALAVFRSGTLTFTAVGGTVRIAEDADAVLAATSQTQDLELEAASSITDAAAAATEVERSAVLVANTGLSDIILGEDNATFSMGTPPAFDATHFLQVTAHDVSIQADSGVNVLSANPVDPDDSVSRSSAVRGTYHLNALGNITQVHGEAGRTEFSANRIALNASEAVYFDSLRVLSSDGNPNLQVHAGSPIDLLSDTVPAQVRADYHTDDIPTDRAHLRAPVLVTVDTPDGDRTDPQGQRRDPDSEPQGLSDDLLENVVENPDALPIAQQFARLEERTDPVPTTTPEENNEIQDDYSLVVQVEGSAIVGDVDDATGAFTEDDTETSRGLVVTTPGNAFLDTTADLTFSGFDADGSESSLAGGDVTVVDLAGGVLTAIAGATLHINTSESNQDAGQTTEVARTTKLASQTGVVTSIGTTDPTVIGDERGPRVIVDQPANNSAAATTGIVRAEDDFEQRITVALGSRGEDNLLVEVEWADVADIREDSELQPAADVDFRTDFAPELGPVPGAQPFADLIQTPVEGIETAGPDDGLSFDQLGEEFRVVTIRHNYAEDFIPFNRAEINQSNNRLPTTVRVFNDPAINLFEDGGNTDLNSSAFALAPQIITQQGGFFLISTPDRPAEYVAPEMIVIRGDAVPSAQRTLGDDNRAAVVSSAETVVYGRVDRQGQEDEWVVDIPGEEWPQTDDNAEGDFLREIRQRIDNGPYSEGRYQIRISTPRGEQLLEEWTKGDLNAEDTQSELNPEDANPRAGDAPNEAAEAPEPAAPAEADRVSEMAPLAPRVSARADGSESAATQAAFAAMAAVGGWRKRLGDRGGFALDSDGVRFTRINRRRRHPRS